MQDPNKKGRYNPIFHEYDDDSDEEQDIPDNQPHSKIVKKTWDPIMHDWINIHEDGSTSG